MNRQLSLHEVQVRTGAVVASVVLAVHGLVHLMGVALLWHLGQPGTLRYADVSPSPGTRSAQLVGAGWLLAAALFVTSAALVLRHRPWHPFALVAAVLSLAVLLPFAAPAAAGIAVDVAVLAGLVLVARRRSRS